MNDQDDDLGHIDKQSDYIIDPVEAAELAKRDVAFEVRRAVHIARYGEASLLFPDRSRRTDLTDPIVHEILQNYNDPLLLAMLRDPNDPILLDMLRDKVNAMLRDKVKPSQAAEPPLLAEHKPHDASDGSAGNTGNTASMPPAKLFATRSRHTGRASGDVRF
jgi:hypothetical protein